MDSPLDVTLSPSSGSEFIGHCIYCNRPPSDTELTTEHVAPDGLLGRWELEAASCKTHRDLTSFIEMRALEGPLEPVRLHYKMYGTRWRKRYRRRHPGGNPDDPLIMERFLLDDGSIETVEIPVSRHPYLLQMPYLEAWPDVLGTGNRRLDVQPRWATHYNAETAERMRQLLFENPRRRAILPRHDDENVMKMLAKIAYCYALYLKMNTPFDPLILKYITSPRGDNSLGRYFIGGPIPRPLELPNERAHSMHIRYEIDKQNPNLVYVVARIHLFNARAMPIYDVVLGTSDEAYPHAP
jgi:hypothetical protein